MYSGVGNGFVFIRFGFICFIVLVMLFWIRFVWFWGCIVFLNLCRVVFFVIRVRCVEAIEFLLLVGVLLEVFYFSRLFVCIVRSMFIIRDYR